MLLAFFLLFLFVGFFHLIFVNVNKRKCLTAMIILDEPFGPEERESVLTQISKIQGLNQTLSQMTNEAIEPQPLTS